MEEIDNLKLAAAGAWSSLWEKIKSAYIKVSAVLIIGLSLALGGIIFIHVQSKKKDAQTIKETQKILSVALTDYARLRDQVQAQSRVANDSIEASRKADSAYTLKNDRQSLETAYIAKTTAFDAEHRLRASLSLEVESLTNIIAQKDVFADLRVKKVQSEKTGAFVIGAGLGIVIGVVLLAVLKK